MPHLPRTLNQQYHSPFSVIAAKVRCQSCLAKQAFDRSPASCAEIWFQIGILSVGALSIALSF